MPYLCYDLKAIQSFIFRVPKLKYIVGGSAIVDEFDREIARSGARACGAEPVSSGGGKGGFYCRDGACAEALEKSLVKSAHGLGLDIRIGTHDDYTEAASCATRLYSYVPEMNGGHPCSVSGLYPTTSRDAAHEVIERRVEGGRHRRFEERLFSIMSLGSMSGLQNPEFLRSLDATEQDGPGRAGFEAMGRRARWAIICMDGNDMGTQFRAMRGRDPATLRKWVAAMSGALDETSAHACAAGIDAVLRGWTRKNTFGSCTYLDKGVVRTVLPVRPLIVGGDDIAVICHPAFAFDFVKAAIAEWQEHSVAVANASEFKSGLWPATGGKLSISAGVFFCPSSMRLHAAVSYTELLLASAKRRGREGKLPPPSPACIDWESATETMLDTPLERRRRELEFIDADAENRLIRLTERPYRLSDFMNLESLSESVGRRLPRSIRHDILPGLRQGAHDRELFRLRLMKSHGELAERLATGNSGGYWTDHGDAISTCVIDALSLLEEQERAEEDR